MQAAKDSFYMVLRERLAGLNAQRTIVVDGIAMPAIVVRENMEPRFGEAQAGAFYVDFGEILIAESTRPMLGVDCHIWYCSEGSGGTGLTADGYCRIWTVNCLGCAIHRIQLC
jgi:hypothetical protein